MNIGLHIIICIRVSECMCMYLHVPLWSSVCNINHFHVHFNVTKHSVRPIYKVYIVANIKRTLVY